MSYAPPNKRTNDRRKNSNTQNNRQSKEKEATTMPKHERQIEKKTKTGSNLIKKKTLLDPQICLVKKHQRTLPLHPKKNEADNRMIKM